MKRTPFWRQVVGILSRRHALRVGSKALIAGGIAAAGGQPLGFVNRAWSTASGSDTPQFRPGSLANPSLPEGEDTIPEIEHVIVLMMENHSFDNYFGMLRRGDGFKLSEAGSPVNYNPGPGGEYVTSFHLPSTCQENARPSQSWVDSHVQFDGGLMDGFVGSASGPVAMGYWDGSDLPFYYSLGKTFPLCDRYFSSVLGPTYPNRRFLVSGTAFGLIDDRFPSSSDPIPPAGTIFSLLSQFGITWKNYYSTLPTAALYLKEFSSSPSIKAATVKVSQYFDDARRGTLPSVSFVDPDFFTGSEEDPQDIKKGEAFASEVIRAAMEGPKWPKTLLVWCYDEHGGYFDHVPPPSVVPPDFLPPSVPLGVSPYDGYTRCGMRVPCVIVSPFAKRNYVSHIVHDHTSILKLIETKWNLPSLTFRDANASNLLDSLDFTQPGQFLDPPLLDWAPSYVASCAPGHPVGSIPPDGAVTNGTPPRGGTIKGGTQWPSGAKMPASIPVVSPSTKPGLSSTKLGADRAPFLIAGIVAAAASVGSLGAVLLRRRSVGLPTVGADQEVSGADMSNVPVTPAKESVETESVDDDPNLAP